MENPRCSSVQPPVAASACSGYPLGCWSPAFDVFRYTLHRLYLVNGGVVILGSFPTTLRAFENAAHSNRLYRSTNQPMASGILCWRLQAKSLRKSALLQLCSLSFSLAVLVARVMIDASHCQ